MTLLASGPGLDIAPSALISNLSFSPSVFTRLAGLCSQNIPFIDALLQCMTALAKLKWCKLDKFAGSVVDGIEELLETRKQGRELTWVYKLLVSPSNKFNTVTLNNIFFVINVVHSYFLISSDFD